MACDPATAPTDVELEVEVEPVGEISVKENEAGIQTPAPAMSVAYTSIAGDSGQPPDLRTV